MGEAGSISSYLFGTRHENIGASFLTHIPEK